MSESRFAAVAAVAAISLFATAPVAQGASVSIGHSGWSWGDPQPQGNTLNSIEFAGGRGYAAGDFGTLLRTDDGGASWTGLSTGLTDDLVRVRAINSDTVVIGGGCALRRSTNAGQSFTRLPWTSSDSDCQSKIASFQFPSASVGYVLTQDGSVLRTDDGGQTFARRTSIPGTSSTGGSRTPTDIWFTSDTNGVATTSASGEGKVFRTIDGGHSWMEVQSVDQPLRGLQFAGGGVGYAVGSGTTILRSIDSGASWSSKKTHTGVPSNLNLTSIGCADANLCLATESDGGLLVRTTDGGDNANTVTPSTQQLFAVAFSSATRAVAVGDRGATVVSDTGGSTWDPVGGKVSGSGYHGVRAQSPLVAQAGEEGGTIARTTDGGVSWFTVGVPTSAAIRSATFPSAAAGYALDDAGGAYKTGNGGSSWAILNTGTTAHPTAIFAPDPSRVLLVGPKGVRLSTDGGNSFAAVRDKDIKKASVDDIDDGGGTLFAFARKALLASADGGTSWKKVKRPKGAPLDDVDFVSAKFGYAFATDGRLWRTKNAGKKWTDVSAIGTDLGSGISFSSQTSGFLSTFGFGKEKLGYVLHTNDGGKTWQPQLIAPQFINIWDAGATAFAITYSIQGVQPGGDFFATTTGGQAGTPTSISLKRAKGAKPAGSAKKGKQVKVSGQLSPPSGGEQIVVSIRKRKRSSWRSVNVQAASNGGFTAKLTVKKPSVAVAQWAGDGSRAGSGSTALKLTPPKRKK